MSDGAKDWRTAGYAFIFLLIFLAGGAILLICFKNFVLTILPEVLEPFAIIIFGAILPCYGAVTLAIIVTRNWRALKVLIVIAPVFLFGIVIASDPVIKFWRNFSYSLNLPERVKEDIYLIAPAFWWIIFVYFYVKVAAKVLGMSNKRGKRKLKFIKP